MLPEPELRRALAEIQPIPLHGPFNRFVSFDAMLSPLDEFVPVPPALSSLLPLKIFPTAALRQRATSPPRPLWGIGSIKNGGRYNKQESFEVVYLAEDPITALAEINMIFRIGESVAKIKGAPVVHIAVDAILGRVLDLTIPATQAALATSDQELTGGWLLEQSRSGEAPTQRLGRIAFEQGDLHAIRYPSAKNNGGVCVAVFHERLSGGSYLQVFDPYDNLAQRIPPRVLSA